MAITFDPDKRVKASAERGVDFAAAEAVAVFAHFRAGGPSWQTRIDDILREVARREGAAIET